MNDILIWNKLTKQLKELVMNQLFFDFIMKYICDKSQISYIDILVWNINNDIYILIWNKSDIIYI